MAIIISRITRAGDIGEPGYSVYGERVPTCRRSGGHDYWHGATQENLISVMPNSYITRSVYNFLSDDERDEIRGRVLGVCEDNCIHTVPSAWSGASYCWALDESKMCADISYPRDPCKGITCTPKCEGTDLYNTTCVDGVCVRGRLIEAKSTQCGFVCNEGEKHGKETCWNNSVIHKELCRNNAWVPTGETCPAMPAHGTKRNPTTCWDGSVIYAEKFDRTLKRWVPTGETPPPKPECSPGDKKAGYVCEEGKWQTAPAVPVPPVEQPVAPLKYLTPAQADERVRSGLPCYIKCTLPVLDMLPGLPYTQGAWVPPFFTITSEP